MSRIALVATGGLDPSGRERVIPAVLWLVERLALQHDVHVYVLRYFDRERSYPLRGATVHDLGCPRGVRRQFIALLGALRRDGPFDIVHAYWALPAGLASVLAGRRLAIPSVVAMDSGEFAAVPDINYGLQLRWKQRIAVTATIRLATRVVVCSRFQEQLARRHGAAPDVIPLGVDCGVFTPAQRPEGPPWRLLHVANLNRVKDQPTLLEAMRRLVDRVPQVHLDIVGVDTLEGSIQTLACRLGLEGHVTFHGFQATEALVAFYQRAHLCLLTSRHEAAGVVVLEAAACGVPTVGTPVGYLADWTPDRAVAVPTADPQALADAVVDPIANPARRARLADAAREWTLAHDADWTAAQFARLYHEIARPSITTAGGRRAP